MDRIQCNNVKLRDICTDIIDCVNKTAPVCNFETPYIRGTEHLIYQKNRPDIYDYP